MKKNPQNICRIYQSFLRTVQTQSNTDSRSQRLMTIHEFNLLRKSKRLFVKIRVTPPRNGSSSRGNESYIFDVSAKQDCVLAALGSITVGILLRPSNACYCIRKSLKIKIQTYKCVHGLNIFFKGIENCPNSSNIVQIKVNLDESLEASQDKTKGIVKTFLMIGVGLNVSLHGKSRTRAVEIA